MPPELTTIIVLLFGALLVWLIWLRQPSPGLGRRRRIRVDGVWRSYTVHHPANAGSTKSPVLLCFHGGLGRVERLRDHSGIKEAALRRGFIAIFPEAPDGWVDARPERGGSRRDLVFIEALLDRLRNKDGETGKVFALGVSNGGMFVFRLAMAQPQRFAGFAAVLASIPAAGLEAPPECPPAPAVLVFGKDDPLMPWSGGRIPQGRRAGIGVGGIVVSAQATLEYWLNRNHARRDPTVRRTGGEGSPVEIRDYPATPGGAPVRFVSIDDWGHEWPRWADDAECPGAFDIADVILEFFSGQPSIAPVHDVQPVRVRLGGTR